LFILLELILRKTRKTLLDSENTENNLSPTKNRTCFGAIFPERGFANLKLSTSNHFVGGEGAIL
jgi:hypothetical protein